MESSVSSGIKVPVLPVHHLQEEVSILQGP